MADPGVPRLASKTAVVEVCLFASELLLVAVPLLSWSGPAVLSSPRMRVFLPLAAALFITTVLLLFDSLRPITTALTAKRQGGRLSPAALAAAERAFVWVPRWSAVLRFVLWLGLSGAFCAALVRGHLASPLAAWGLAGGVLCQATAAAALRALWLSRILVRVRPAVLPNVEAVRFLAATCRADLALAALAVFGLGHAALALAALAFTTLSREQVSFLSLLLGPVVWPAVFLGWRSLRRRTEPLQIYFRAVLGAPGSRGPARDDPRAVAAFVACQSLPYRLAGGIALTLALAGVFSLAAGRRGAHVTAHESARLLGALAVVVVGVLVYGSVGLRRRLGPLMKHLGSRHLLPITVVRSPVGLTAKLLALLLGTGGVVGGLVGLFTSVVSHDVVLPVIALVSLTLFVTGVVVLAVNDLVSPIAALESRSEEMSRGELARPVPPSSEADEIGRLTVAFEEMRRSLRDRLRSTESINVDLEREVRRRTEAMEQRNLELRDAMDQLRRAQDNLVRSEKLASMGRLVAGIAHEVNNPLNAVINSLTPLEEILNELARSTNPAEVATGVKQAEEILGVIQRGSGRTKAIVQALHNYSRGDEAVAREVNLARSVDDSLDLLRHRLRHVSIVKEVDPLARISGFPGQIDQVLLNLITNAVQAIGDRPGEIRVAVSRQAGGVVVRVTDNGPGIPPGLLPRIFDPFFTTKDVGEGSGLGLSIVHGIIERHQGTIDVHSVVGVGTTFTLTFPPLAG